MTRRRLPPLRSALPVLALLAAPAIAATLAGPSLAQAQAAMDTMFDAAIADRPTSDSSRLVAEAFRPRLKALSSCLPVAGTTSPTVDCIVTAQAGPEPVHRLLRFSLVQAQWTLAGEQRNLPVPVPPVARVQVLLREQFRQRLARSDHAQIRRELEYAAGAAEVLAVEDCEIGDEAPVIECEVTATAGDERGQQSMAFTVVNGAWENAGTAVGAAAD